MAKPWSESEDLLIKQYYPSGGVGACLDAVLGRTGNAIYARALRLGLYQNGDGTGTLAPNAATEQGRREDIVKTVLRHRSKSVALIADELRKRYGEFNEIVGGDELYPSETTWYFKAPERNT